MPEDKKLTREEQEAAFREVRTMAEQGLLDPVLRFDPDGFDLSVNYSRDKQRVPPIPEFRVYAQQFLTLLAIVLISHRKFLAQATTVLECRIEVAGDGLNMVLIAEASLPSAISSSGEAPALHLVGTAFSNALRSLFPQQDAIFWDRELTTGHAKLWMQYPGRMTANGFLKTAGQPFFGWVARLDLPHPTDEQYLRAIAVLDFIIGDSAGES